MLTNFDKPKLTPVKVRLKVTKDAAYLLENPSYVRPYIGQATDAAVVSTISCLQILLDDVEDLVRQLQRARDEESEGDDAAQ